MNTKKTLLAIVLLVVFAAIVSLGGPGSSSQAQVVDVDNYKLNGYAWSSNIGWIRFGGLNYPTVKWNTDDNKVSGYAWSSNIGWINMQPSGPYPAAPEHGVRVEGGTLTGWARACAGAPDPASCSGDHQDLEDHDKDGDTSEWVRHNGDSDDWTGWIKMSGPTLSGSTYGVKLNQLANSQDRGLSSFAWGDTVVGWVDFAVCGEQNTGTCNPACQVCVDDDDDDQNLSAICQVDDTQVKPGESVTWRANIFRGISPFTYEWNIDDVPGNPATQSVTKSFSDEKVINASVKIRHSAPGNNLPVVSTCPAVTISNEDDDDGDDDEVPGGTGKLTITEPSDGIIYIRNQAAGKSAYTVDDASNLALKIVNDGNATVKGIYVEDVISQKTGKSLLGGGILPTETPAFCAYQNDGGDTFTGTTEKSCKLANLGDLPPGESLFFRLKVPDRLKSIADNNPYEVVIKGTVGVAPAAVTVSTTDPGGAPKSVIFDYLVSTFDPR